MADKFIHLDEKSFINEAKSIIEKAQEKGIVLRILGALGVFLHTDDPSLSGLFYSLGRLGEGKPLFTDLDVVGYSKQVPLVKKFFEQDLKFKGNVYVNTLFAYKRNIFEAPDGLYSVDVFYDRLEYSHNVEFGNSPGRGRLEIDFPTITLADIVLEKLQIHEINRKDLIDLTVLFAGHDVLRSTEKETVDSGYISKVLANDWGFYYDAVMNLNKVKDIASQFKRDGKIPDEVLALVNERVDTLLKTIEDEPKTPNWIKRSKRGTTIPWYRDVEEVDR
ncbi:MAG: hypothetical protein ACP5SB_02275 [Caldisericaceae bacterium]